MRSVLIVLVLAGSAWSQALTETTAAIAGGSVGGVAGKKVSDGITNVFQNVDATAKKAAKTGSAPATAVQKAPQGTVQGATQRATQGTILQVGSGGVVKDHSLVPPPPPPVRRAAVVPPPPPVAAAASVSYIQPIPVLPPPPPPHATPEDLQALASGTNRSDVLKLGPPSSRITMFDDGHLVEIFRYQARDTTFGVVRLSDGSVSKVEVR
jgi:hypothetical protein